MVGAVLSMVKVIQVEFQARSVTLKIYNASEVIRVQV